MRVRPTVNDSATPTEVSVIDADKVGGFEASQTPASNEIPVLSATGDFVHGDVSTISTKTTAQNFGGNKTYGTFGGISNSFLASNAYLDGSTWKRTTEGTASAFMVSPTVMRLYRAVTGAADSTITWTTSDIFTISTDGNVLLGSTEDASTGILQVTGDSYFSGDVSAATFTDRTPFFEGDALTLVRRISGKDGELNHKSLPTFAYVKKVKKDDEGLEVEEEGRDIGAMLSVLTVAVQQLLERVEALEGK